MKIRTITEPSSREGKFRYTVRSVETPHGSRQFGLPGSRSGEEEKVWEGTWQAELKGLDDAWKVKSSRCTETDGETPSSAVGATADIGVDPGDRVTCTFRLKLIAPEPGPWTSRTRDHRVSCPGYDESFGPTTAAGTIKVRDGGDHLVARGLGGRSTTWNLHRDPDDPLRYSGRVRVNQQDASGTFDLDLRMQGEHKLVGTFGGQTKVRGITCKVSSPLTLRFAGD